MDQPSLPDTPAPSAMQSALAQRTAWVLEFEPGARREIELLLGWTSTGDPFGSMRRLRLPGLPAATDFAERHG